MKILRHTPFRYARETLAWTEKQCSFRNEKLNANKASETEEQRKERLRIRREKDRARRRTKKLQEEKQMSSEREDHEKKRLPLTKIEVR